MKASLGCLLYLGLLLSLLVRGTVSNKPHGFGSLPNSGLSDGVQDNETINEESLRALSEAQNASISARWYSVDTIANLEADGNMQATAHGPWPVVCGQQYVRYCFKDEQSAQDLTSIVAHAIVMWFPAGFYSGMVIQPDPACGKPGEYNDYSCVCGEQEEGGRTSDDALVIDNGADGSDNPPLVIASTIGYNRASDEPGRHSLTFSLLRQPDGASSHLFRGYQISHMTHELGHAIGLAHEHQRPDRDHFVKLNYRWLSGFPQAVEAVSANLDGDFAARTSWEDRLQNEQWTEKYFPLASDFIPGHLLTGTEYFDYSDDTEPFDYASIMIYSSTAGDRDDLPDRAENLQWPLLRKRRGDESDHSPESLIFQGGKSDRESWNKRISAYDIKRVAALYPGTERQQAEARNLGDKPGQVNWAIPNGQTFAIEGWVDAMAMEPNPIDVAYATYEGELLGNNNAPEAASDGEGAAGDLEVPATGADMIQHRAA